MTSDLKHILFVDIETAAGTKDYSDLQERLQSEWDKKSSYFRNADTLSSAELYEERAGIFAEFGKIITIAVGFFTFADDKQFGLRIKSYASHDEKKLLQDFCALLENKFSEELTLCAHNGKEFDFPYLCRRLIIHGIDLPFVLDTQDRKPWEVNHIDTMEMWKFGDRKSFTSLELLASLFDIESSKEGIDGSMVNSVYYEEKDLPRIAKYCMHDVAVTAQVFLRLKNIKGFDPEKIVYLPIKVD